jgi:hypothetical protein
VLHPVPVGPLIKLGRHLLDLFVVEEGPAGQRPAKKKTGVDRRDFRIQHPLARLAVHEVIQKPVLVLHALQRETQRGFYPVADRTFFLVAALRRNAQRRQPEARSRDTRRVSERAAIGRGPVLYLAGLRICLFPEIQK